MRISISVILVSSCGLLLTGCKRSSRNIITPQKFSECAGRMSVVFPQSARPVGVYERHGMDDSIHLKVDIDIRDLAQFIQNSPFIGITLSDNSRSVFPLKRLSWWDIENVVKYQSGEVQLPDASYLKILIGLDDPNIASLYIHWFET